MSTGKGEKMSKIKRLIEVYKEFVSLPWRHDSTAEERIMFCVYDEQDELKMRMRIDEFELVTRDAGHRWECFDLTDAYPRWFALQKYAERYYRQPHLLPSSLEARFIRSVAEDFQKFLEETLVDADTVAALTGVGSLYGFVKVKDIVDVLAPLFAGKLLVFFPGRLVEHSYRLLDGYDGWSYRAVPILDTN